MSNEETEKKPGRILVTLSGYSVVPYQLWYKKGSYSRPLEKVALVALQKAIKDHSENEGTDEVIWNCTPPEMETTQPALTVSQRIEGIRNNPCASHWLKDALASALHRDPLDSYYDSKELLAVLEAVKDNALNQSSLAIAS